MHRCETGQSCGTLQGMSLEQAISVPSSTQGRQSAHRSSIPAWRILQRSAARCHFLQRAEAA